MNTFEILKTSNDRMKNNSTPAIALTMAELVMAVCMLMIGIAASLFFDTILFYKPKSPMLPIALGTITAIIVHAATLKPFKIGIKSWYYNIGPESSLLYAFYCFMSPKRYKRAIKYSLLKVTANIFIIAAVVLPNVALIMFTSHCMQIGADTMQIIIAIALLVFLNVAAVFTAGYIYIGFYFTDYIYLTDNEAGIAEIFKMSFELSKGKRRQILRLAAIQAPYYIISVLIATMLFTMPVINSSYALYAKNQLSIQAGGKNVDIK